MKDILTIFLALFFLTPSTALSREIVKDSFTRSKVIVKVPRDTYGRIKRSTRAKREFMRQTGYAHGRPGYVVDHIIPLKRGGKDDPSNMQWQTIDDAKAKDRWE